MRPSFSSVQSLVALAAGFCSIAGGIYSGVEYLRPAPRAGEMIAVVHDARTSKPVTGGSIEILAADESLVATLSPSDNGLAHHALRPGAYRLRVRHPRFASETRSIEVPEGGSVEVRFELAQRDADAANGKTPVGAAKRLLQRLGF